MVLDEVNLGDVPRGARGWESIMVVLRGALETCTVQRSIACRKILTFYPSDVVGVDGKRRRLAPTS